VVGKGYDQTWIQRHLQLYFYKYPVRTYITADLNLIFRYQDKCPYLYKSIKLKQGKKAPYTTVRIGSIHCTAFIHGVQEIG